MYAHVCELCKQNFLPNWNILLKFSAELDCSCQRQGASKCKTIVRWENKSWIILQIFYVIPLQFLFCFVFFKPHSCFVRLLVWITFSFSTNYWANAASLEWGVPQQEYYNIPCCALILYQIFYPSFTFYILI